MDDSIMDETNIQACVTFDDVLKARKRLDGHIETTPVFTCPEIDERVGRQVFLKAENLQKTGSFKIRGAFNAVSVMNANGEFEPNGSGDRPTAVATSCGNHGAGLAWACQYYGVPCKVFMPYDAGTNKIENIKKYCGQPIICTKEQFEDKEVSTKFLKQNLFEDRPVHHRHICSGSYNVIAGQGTVGLELLEEVPDLDAMVVAAGGGGLLAGVTVVVKNINPNIKVFAAEPFGKELKTCLKSGERLLPGSAPRIDTVAEGVRRKELLPHCWDVCHGKVETNVLTVTDQEIVDAVKLVFSEMKLVVEVTAGVGVAAVLSNKMKSLDPSVKKVGVILCGGNADLDNLPWTKPC